jgi:UDP:flavonoid glycosyltransferase YjiC (YdhE family)
VRLDTYGHEAGEMRAAIDGLLGDAALGERLGALSSHLQEARGAERAANRIEELAAE